MEGRERQGSRRVRGTKADRWSAEGDAPALADWEFPGRGDVLAYLVRSGRPDLAKKLAVLWEPVSDAAGSAVAGNASRLGAVPQQGLGPAVPYTDDPRDALPLGERTLIMGVLNVTPDSFYDGSRFADPETAVQRALEMVRAGVDVIDVGGESTRPGADPVPAKEEIQRVLPVIAALKDRVRVPISIDTYKPEVADAALAAGAHIVNDVTGLGAGTAMAEVIARHGAGAILMHMKGEPRTMQLAPHYDCVVGEIVTFLADRSDQALAAGVRPERLWLDPGIGFGKNLEHNMELMSSMRALRALGFPVVLGPSRKSFIGALLKLDVCDRLEATAALVALAAAQRVDMVRVHDVEAMVRVARTSDALVRGWRHHEVYVGIGTNMGDREANIKGALQALADLPETWVEACSSLYETGPVGYVEQPPFYNMVVRLRTGLDPRRLLRELMAIEKDFGRVRDGERWGPRPLDLDILLFDDVVSGANWLTLPHPRMEERGFVLVPLAEIAPDVAWRGASAQAHLAALEATGHFQEYPVRKVQAPPERPMATAR